MSSIFNLINQISLKFLEPLSLKKTYETTVSEARRLVDAQYGSILLENKGLFERVYTSSPKFYKIKARKKGFTYRAFKTQRAFTVDVSKTEKIHPRLKKIGIKSSIFIPLVYHEKPIGVLSLASLNKEQFTQKKLEILKLFGSMASLAIRKAQLHNEMQNAIEARDYFISMAAHELRTPLTTINGYVQLLCKKLCKENLPQSRWAEQLLWETNRLTQLINELLEVNRIKTGNLNYLFKEYSGRKLIEKSISNFKFAYPNRKIIYSEKLNKGLDTIIGDPDKLEQVFDNLLENAAKFSCASEEIKVTLKFKSRFLVVTIKDNGGGIPQDELLKILSGSYRRSAKNQEDGMGLGLFLAKNIIKVHRGVLDIKSKINGGTTVEVMLPRQKFS